MEIERFGTLEEIFELTHRVLCDTLPPYQGKGLIRAGLAYLYGQSTDNERSVLDRGLELAEGDIAELLGICGNDEGYGYRGGPAWFNDIRDRGLSANRILYIMRVEKDFPPSTNSEADGLMLELAKPKWKDSNIIVCASPLHQVRAFVSSISAMRKAGLFFPIYNVVGTPLPWLQNIVHSQGTTFGVRRELIVTCELDNLRKYSDDSETKAPLLKAKDVLAYLNERDAS